MANPGTVRQMTYPCALPAESIVGNLRNRLDAITAELLASVEENGAVDGQGKPNPLLIVLTALCDTGTEIRRLSVERRTLAMDIQDADHA